MSYLPDLIEAPQIVEPRVSSSDGFIQANTEVISLSDLSSKCVIPVFAKDNESTISHNQFIETIAEGVNQFYSGEEVLLPAIRVSHPIKGRIPEAMGKPAHLLTDEEKTIYYERMAFMIEVPTIRDTVADNSLSLIIGGVRAYNHENLYSKKSPERFKLFVGFKNMVCTNLCISTDGFKADIRVQTIGELYDAFLSVLGNYKAIGQIRQLQSLSSVGMSEKQFAQLIGRLRMYQYLPNTDKNSIPALDLGDSQISTVVKHFFEDENFSRESGGFIDMWSLYNLFTEANKSSYLDRFADRVVNVDGFVRQLADTIRSGSLSWYLN